MHLFGVPAAADILEKLPCLQFGENCDGCRVGQHSGQIYVRKRRYLFEKNRTPGWQVDQDQHVGSSEERFQPLAHPVGIATHKSVESLRGMIVDRARSAERRVGKEWFGKCR